MDVMWHIQSPTGASGAIAIIQISGSARDLEGALRRLGLPVIGVGQLRLVNLLDVDRGVLVRWSDTSVHLFPHGGSAVVRGIARALAAAGLREALREAKAPGIFPEAASELEATVLAALSRAASPLAVDLLLDQPQRWRKHGPPDPAEPRHGVLQRLIDPPLVVAIGPSNVGKSSLVNALAGRGVSLVADEPGTTRDHVGVLIDMGGLVVRYIDSPGMRTGAAGVEAEAVELAAAIARGADLILRCGDAAQAPPDGPPDTECLTVALRCDLGVPSWRHDVAVSVMEPRGVPDLVAAIRHRLVPQPVLEDPRPWWIQLPGLPG